MPTFVQDDRSPASTAPGQQKLHLFVLIDALGWEYLKGRSFLDDVLSYRRPIRTVLGFSSGAIPTILTGCWPSVTGHWNLFYYDPTGSPFRWLKYFTWVPDRVLNHRITTKILKEMGRHVLGLGPLFECCVNPSFLRWFNWVEMKNFYDSGGISGAASIFDYLEQNGIPRKVYSYHHWTDTEIFRLAAQDIASRAAHFYFLYLSEMDMFLHTHCADEKKLDGRIAWYEQRLKSLYEQAREIDPDTTLTILSDHGMTPVHHYYDVIETVGATGLRIGKDYIAVYDSTMARFWFFNDEARQKITSALGSAPCGRILTDQELRALGVFFEDRRFGEMIFLLQPGWIFSKSDFNGPQWKPTGMHGYHPDDSYSDAIFLTSRTPNREMRTIADVYGFMREAVR